MFRDWVREGVIYRPGERSKLVRLSPIISLSRNATEAQEKGIELYLTPEQVEEALVDSVDIPRPRRYIKLPTKRFGQEELTVFVFDGEKEANQYGTFLIDRGIHEIAFYVRTRNINNQPAPFASQLLFEGGDGEFDLNAVGDYFLGDRMVRGARKLA